MERVALFVFVVDKYVQAFVESCLLLDSDPADYILTYRIQHIDRFGEM